MELVSEDMSMADLRFPVIELDGNLLQVNVDLSIYSQEALTATCYKYAGDYYVHQQKDAGGIVNVIFESKNASEISADIPKQFCCDLVDQQLRVDTNKQFGHIRDLIVEEAFMPITKKK